MIKFVEFVTEQPDILPCLSRLLTERAELPFCVDGSWASGVRVERDGSGLIQVWSRQIQQLNRVSPAVASAVTAAYPSPQLLLQVQQGALQFGTKELSAHRVVLTPTGVYHPPTVCS